MLTSVEIHRNESPTQVRCMIITVSDTRTSETDVSGTLLRTLMEASDYDITDYQIVHDSYEHIQIMIHNGLNNPNVEAILLHGGTGIALRDTTYEAVRDLLDKEMHGFGELFRYLSYTEDIGSSAILSRAIAGIASNKAIFSMPGSSGAVKLAATKIIIPELRHVMREIYKDL
ncbi:MogA/MoaB family molybdenum cofactor biosynthesis protein [Paenibacillus sp. CMAA1364]